MLKDLLKEIVTEILTGKKNGDQKEDIIESSFVGKKCLVRTYSAGIHFGTVAQLHGTHCVLKNAQRIYDWKGATCCSQLAMEGVANPKKTRITMPVEELILTQTIEIIPMTEKAFINLSKECTQWKI